MLKEILKSFHNKIKNPEAIRFRDFSTNAILLPASLAGGWAPWQIRFPLAILNRRVYCNAMRVNSPYLVKCRNKIEHPYINFIITDCVKKFNIWQAYIFIIPSNFYQRIPRVSITFFSAWSALLSAISAAL